jgi:hypothetical protein
MSGEQTTLKRREFLRWGAVGAGAALFSSAGAGASLPAMLYNQPQAPADPLAPLPQVQVQAPSAPTAPAGIEPALFERAKAAMNQHSVWYRDVIGIVDFSKPSSDTRFHVVDLQNGSVASYLVAHGRGSDPDHSGYLQRFSNEPGSYASSNGTYTTGDIYDGKHGTSMRLAGLDWTNNNAEARAIVIHSAWYAEPEILAQHGQLGRSEGCFAMPQKAQWEVMQKLTSGHMIYAEKIA